MDKLTRVFCAAVAFAALMSVENRAYAQTYGSDASTNGANIWNGAQTFSSTLGVGSANALQLLGGATGTGGKLYIGGPSSDTSAVLYLQAKNPTAWAPNTAYALNATVEANGNSYKATTAGTSATTVGPTGTGSSIADGTVVWAYQFPQGAVTALSPWVGTTGYFNPGTTTYFGAAGSYNPYATVFQVRSNLAGSANTSPQPMVLFYSPSDSVALPPSSGELALLQISENLVAGASGNRWAEDISSGSTGGTASPEGIRSTVNANNNLGGTSLASPSGSIFAANFSTGANNATYMSAMTGLEIDIEASGSTTVNRKSGLSITKGPLDSVQGSQFDYAFNISDGDGASVPWEDGILFGGLFGQWPFNATSTLIEAQPGYTLATPQYGYGLDLWNASASNYAIRAPGPFAVDGSGNTQIGVGLLEPSSSGMNIDVAGVEGLGIPAIASGGTGYHVNDLIYFSNGGIASVTSTSGNAITSLTIVREPFLNSATSEPSNPVSTTPDVFSTGSGATFSVSWTSYNTLSLNPSGGSVQFGSGAFTADGTTSASLTALAPSGAHATVQEWMTIKDASGNTRYIPTF